jgi:hypothetical protein
MLYFASMYNFENIVLYKVHISRVSDNWKEIIIFIGSEGY